MRRGRGCAGSRVRDVEVEYRSREHADAEPHRSAAWLLMRRRDARACGGLRLRNGNVATGRGGSPPTGDGPPSLAVCKAPAVCLPPHEMSDRRGTSRCMAGRLRRRARASTAQVLRADQHRVVCTGAMSLLTDTVDCCEDRRCGWMAIALSIRSHPTKRRELCRALISTATRSRLTPHRRRDRRPSPSWLWACAAQHSSRCSSRSGSCLRRTAEHQSAPISPPAAACTARLLRARIRAQT